MVALFVLPARVSAATDDAIDTLPFEELLNTSYELYKNDDFDAALGLIREGKSRFPDDRISFLNLEYMVLDKTNDVACLVEVAIERARYFENSPKKSREVVLALLRNNQNENALRWMEITLERGYQDHADLLSNPAYDPLRDTTAFKQAVRTIGSAIGIDQKAKGFQGQALDGSQETLENYLGKVVLVDFWAVYCGPCLAEIDAMLGYYPALKDDGFEILSINLDEDRAKVTDYVDEKNIPWPVIFSGKGWDDDIRTEYDLANIPSYWLIDRQGTLRSVGLQGKQLEEKIGALLEE
jgi:thiol-disulfide isomerase/thioredoxin